jgi:hypothetical protein
MFNQNLIAAIKTKIAQIEHLQKLKLKQKKIAEKNFPSLPF